MTDLSKNIQALREKKAVVEMGGGEAAIEKQIAMGKLTARDRILSLLDKNSFHEYDLFVKHDGRDFGMDKKDLPGDGVVTGTGTIFGAPVCIYAQDFTVAGGSLGLQHARKITKIMDHALKMKCPIIGINDSGGARIQEGVGALAGYGEIFYRNTIASGVIPQISLILGPCAGGAVYSPALTDFVFVVENISKMFITGPNVIKTVLGEDISMEDLGGARVHAEITGNAHFYAQSEQECFEQVKRLVSFIPWNNQQHAKAIEPKEPAAMLNIDEVVPADPKQPYDVRDVIKCIVDDSDFLEVQELWAANIVIGFGRMGGETVGFVANQPMVLAGVLDCDSADKAARFIRFCDSFNIPIITLEDMLEEIVGDIRDEYDGDEEKSIQRIAPREYMVDGSVKLDDLDERLNLELQSDEYDSIGGLVIGLLNHLPQEKEEVVEENVRLVVECVDKNRIDKIHLYLLSPSEAALAKHTADGAASGAEGEGKQQG